MQDTYQIKSHIPDMTPLSMPAPLGMAAKERLRQSCGHILFYPPKEA